jgi:hypothetical protein
VRGTGSVALAWLFEILGKSFTHRRVRRRHLARQAEKYAHPARLPAGRAPFMRTLAIASPEDLRQADHKAVIAWERYMRETEHPAASAIWRGVAALSSLYKHLVRSRGEEPGERGRAAGD